VQPLLQLKINKHYSERVFVALGIQHAMCVHLVICGLPAPTLEYISALSHKRGDFRKNGLLNIKCVFLFSLQLLSETVFILKIIERDMIKSTLVFT
jgi:hypothetical protein